VVGDYFYPKIALSGGHPIARKTGVALLSGARNGKALAAIAPGYQLVDEYPVMERIGTGQRLAARAFAVLSRGGRAYVVAHLRVDNGRKG